MKVDIAQSSEIVPGNSKCILACIEEMELACARCDHHRPRAAAAADIDADRIGGQIIPERNMEGSLKAASRSAAESSSAP